MEPSSWPHVSELEAEVLRKCPLAASLGRDRALMRLVSYDHDFLGLSLLENHSIADGQRQEFKRLFVVDNGWLREVEVKRVAKAIYPPSYLHPGTEYPLDEDGWSETVGEALARVNLSQVDAIVLHRYGIGEDGTVDIAILNAWAWGHSNDILDQFHTALVVGRRICHLENVVDFAAASHWRLIEALSVTSALKLIAADCDFCAIILNLLDDPQRANTSSDSVSVVSLAMKIREWLPDIRIVALTKNEDLKDAWINTWLLQDTSADVFKCKELNCQSILGLLDDLTCSQPSCGRASRGSETVKEHLETTSRNAALCDVFVSHATEDKQYVKPLVEALQAAGIHVWFDEISMKWGDDLRPTIDRGLSNCRYGIVVLSKAFLGKRKWTEYELNALFAREQEGHLRILPIWHGIDRNDLIAYSPAFADRLAKSSAKDKYSDIVAAVLAMVRG